jgi:hypothetical protein
MVVLVSPLSFSAMFTGMRPRLDRWEGVLFISIYAVCIAVLVSTAKAGGWRCQPCRSTVLTK